ncbi:MAG: flagellar filament capping protein FliD [Thermodesulfobacteriota bacterium]
MAITATGLVSSIDYDSIIQQLVSVKSLPVDQLIADKKKLEHTQSSYTTLASRVTDLETAANDLKTLSGFDSFTSSSSDTSILDATAGTSALAGSSVIVVNALAKSHKMAADGVAASTTVVASAAGSFNFTVGTGTMQSVAVDAATTVTGLSDAINALNAGVSASVVNDGTSYRLVLTANSTGTANQITINQNDTTLAFNTTLQAAQDASLTVDGLAVTRSSNTISDVLTGVTLNLKSTGASAPVTVTTSRDVGEIEKKIVAFVDRYNAAMSYIKSNNRYDIDTKTGGALFGDPIARSVADELSRIMTSAVSGLPDTMNRLIHVGVTRDTNGVMSLNSAKLKDALNTNYSDVVNLFVEGTSTSGFGKLVYDLTKSMNDSVDGRITKKQEGLGSNIASLVTHITSKEQEISDYEASLRVRFSLLERTLAGLKAQGQFLSAGF